MLCGVDICSSILGWKSICTNMNNKRTFLHDLGTWKARQLHESIGTIDDRIAGYLCIAKNEIRIWFVGIRTEWISKWNWIYRMCFNIGTVEPQSQLDTKHFQDYQKSPSFCHRESAREFRLMLNLFVSFSPMRKVSKVIWIVTNTHRK